MPKRQRHRRDQRRRREARRAGARRRRILAGAGFALGASLAVSPSAQATVDTFTVDLDDDPAPSGGCTVGACSLREAVTASEADDDTTDQDKIVFAAALSGNTITLGSVLPFVYEALWIQGSGAANTTISGNSGHILFFRNPDNDAVKVSDITLRDGATGDGPAINLSDTNLSLAGAPDLTVEDAVLTNNGGSGTGGAISSFTGGNITVLDSTISGNTSGQSGGGVYARLQNGKTLTITNSQITGNTATGGFMKGGGGVFSTFTPVVIGNSTISGNHTTGPDEGGGGIGIFRAPATITRSTISGNYTTGADADGGGLYSVGGDFPYGATTIESSTISGNSTMGASAAGGGLYSGSATTIVRNSTIAQNQAGSGTGGGAFTNNDDDDPILANTIVADNFAGTTQADPVLGTVGDTFQAAFSLIEVPGAPVNATVAGSNLTGLDPQLGGLGSNSGPTQTHALLLTSPAIDCGSSGAEATDQRGAGFPRPVDLAGRTNSTATGANGADIGAFELQTGVLSGACANNAPASAASANPSNDIEFGAVKRNTKKGTATLTVTVKSSGEISLGGTGVAEVALARASRQVAAGSVELKVKPTAGKAGRKIRKALSEKGKATVKPEVTFTPTGGTANTETTKVKLVKN